MPPLLDLDALLAPIPGNNPAGSPVPFETQRQFKEWRIDDNPADAETPAQMERLRKADWPGILRQGKETLTRVSKDLLVAARITEALVRIHWFAGLREGMRLLRGMIEQCWDRMYPGIEDGDLDVRAGPFTWLDDPDKGARLPNTIRSLPLLLSEEGRYGLIDIRGIPPMQPPLSKELVQKALLKTPAEYCAKVEAEIAQCQEERTALIGRLGEKMGETAPGLTAVHQALDECGAFIKQILPQVRPPPAQQTNSTGQGPAPAVVSADAGRAPSSRAEAYRQLAQAAEVLRVLEPHSPIPYLVLRAVELGSLKFPDLIKALIRDANTLNELKREMGIKEPPTQE